MNLEKKNMYGHLLSQNKLQCINQSSSHNVTTDLCTRENDVTTIHSLTEVSSYAGNVNVEQQLNTSMEFICAEMMWNNIYETSERIQSFH